MLRLSGKSIWTLRQISTSGGAELKRNWRRGADRWVAGKETLHLASVEALREARLVDRDPLGMRVDVTELGCLYLERLSGQDSSRSEATSAGTDSAPTPALEPSAEAPTMSTAPGSATPGASGVPPDPADSPPEAGGAPLATAADSPDGATGRPGSELYEPSPLPGPQRDGESGRTTPGRGDHAAADGPASPSPTPSLDAITAREADVNRLLTALGFTSVAAVAQDLYVQDARAAVLHQSHLTTLMRCPMQFRFRYLDGLIRPPGVSLAMGTACHAAVAANLEHKMAKGTLLAVADVEAIADEALAAQWRDGIYVPAEDEHERTKTQIYEQARDLSRRMSAHHHRALAPYLYPVAVERSFTLDVPAVVGTRDGKEIESAAMRLRGRIDIQEPVRVRDSKFGGHRRSQAEADTTIQFGMYGLAVWAMDRVLPDQYCLDVVVGKEGAAPILQSLTTTRTRQDMKLVLAYAREAQRVIDAGLFPPCDPTNWWCCERFCGYWAGVCPFGRRGRSRPGEAK